MDFDLSPVPCHARVRKAECEVWIVANDRSVGIYGKANRRAAESAE
jgi:hypothetical protein